MMVVSGACDDREPDFLDALHRRFEGFVGHHGTITEHAFRDDDGIVHQHADGQHQAHHRQHVEAQSGKIQRPEGNREREWHRRGDDQGGGDLAQEQVEDDDSQQRTDHACIQ